ncbi:hypothetical protein D3C73_924440 [compost metagenome]
MWKAQGQAQGDRAAQRIAQQRATPHTDGLQKRRHAVDEEVQVVLHVLGFVRTAETRQVEHDIAIAGSDQLRVVALEVAEATGARPAAVQPQHHGAGALIQIVQAQAVGQGRVMADGQGQVYGLVHGVLHCLRIHEAQRHQALRQIAAVN